MSKYYFFNIVAYILAALEVIGVIVGTILIGIFCPVELKLLYIAYVWLTLFPVALLCFTFMTLAKNCLEIEELKEQVKKLSGVVTLEEPQKNSTYCTKCGSVVLEEDQGLCQNCGKIQEESKDNVFACPNCNEICLSEKDKFCKKCGTQIKANR